MNQAMESTGVEGLGGSYMELNPEKFAELIILECAAYAEYAKGDTDIDYQKYFKGRFGVE
jgi:hypothetical protein